MTKTLQTALAPLLIIGSFCSVGLFEYPLGQPRPFLSCLYVLVIWSFITYFVYYPFFLDDDLKNVENSINLIILIITIASIFVSFFRFKELKMCLHELSMVDDTLEALGIPKEYQRLRNWIIRIILGWIVYIFIDLAIDTDFFMESIYFMYLIFVDNYPVFVNILSALIWGTILGYISSRFHRVNDCLRVFYSDLSENNAAYRRQNRSILVRQRITGIKDCKQHIWIIMHVHLQLCLISHKLNKVFKVQISLQIIWYFLETIYACNYIYWSYINPSTSWGNAYDLDELPLYFRSILYSILFLTLNYICQTIYHKINDTVKILYELSNLENNLREQILQFILQIKQKEVKFGIEPFYLGYNLIRQLYDTVLSVLMTFIQLGLSE